MKSICPSPGQWACTMNSIPFATPHYDLNELFYLFQIHSSEKHVPSMGIIS